MSVQLILENIGPINNCTIDLDQLTVLVGDNNTGKSLICKSFYLMVNGLGMGKIETEQFLKDNVFNPELFVCENCKSSLTLMDGTMALASVKFNPFEVTINNSDPMLKDCIYVDSPLILNEKSPKEPTSMWYKDDLKQKLIQSKQFQCRHTDEIIEILNTMLTGNLVQVENKNYLYYKRSDGVLVETINTPNGLKTLLLIKTLLLNGYLTKGTILMLDETEIFLHPAWQLKYARILTLLIKYCGLTVLIDTSSLYFIEALDMFSKYYGIGEGSHFYLSQRTGNGVSFSDEKEDMQKIYNSLLSAFEELDYMRLEQDGAH